MIYIKDGDSQWLIRKTLIDLIYQEGDKTIIRVQDRQDIVIADPELFKRLLFEFKHTKV